jgi:hypothetical protein
MLRLLRTDSSVTRYPRRLTTLEVRDPLPSKINKEERFPKYLELSRTSIINQNRIA